MNDSMGNTPIGLLDEQSNQERRLGWATVLVVDDDQHFTRPLARHLTSEGINVITANDGISGIDKVLLEDPDVILLDIHVPRLHGFKFLHWLRGQLGNRAVPVVVLTGDPDPRIEERAKRWGVGKVFRKPVSHRQLVKAIRDIL